VGLTIERKPIARPELGCRIFPRALLARAIKKTKSHNDCISSSSSSLLLLRKRKLFKQVAIMKPGIPKIN
jgi:hypothetical protein